MPLNANRDVNFFTTQELIDVPVDVSTVIYKGAFVGRNRSTGYARPLVIGDEYLGIAYRQANNNYSGATAGGISVRLHQRIDIVHTVAGVAIADLGRDVYAIDDSTLITTPLSGSRVGKIVGIEGTNLARVRCETIFGLAGVVDNLPIIQLADASATLTLDHMNRLLLIANTAARTLTLPPVATVRAGCWFKLVKTNAAAFAVTIDPNAAETIDGAATLATVDGAYDTVEVVATASEWVVLSRDIT
ncbi:MAG: hypothetical protein U1D55_18555 [Phycisphaerae bacterium]